ncbi:hypothetical protein JYT44_03815 [Caldithrix abyssi]|nr:hypothetical protein [Caldithrix abyssi]
MWLFKFKKTTVLKLPCILCQKKAETPFRVTSANGEKEQGGKIFATGGVHEAEFFQRFFAGMNQGLFLDVNAPAPVKPNN